MKNRKEKNNDIIKKYSERLIKDDFVPLNERDLKNSISVGIKEGEVEIIDKKNKKVESNKKSKSKSKKTNKKSKKSKSSLVEDWIEYISKNGNNSLNKNGPILVITEKPQAALKIAYALGEKVVKKTSGNVPYYEIMRGEKIIQVACAVGHLFTLTQKEGDNSWPVFELTWVPNFIVKKNDFTKKYYEVIEKLCRRASEIIIATDYDIEGEVIGMNIVRYICKLKDAKRMKFSTLTAEEINKSYENRANSLDWKQGIAGETRHYLDWMYGINLSRALMDAIKSIGFFRIMSIGRVQGPTLKILAKRELQIINFKPEKYWDIYIDVVNNIGQKVRLKLSKSITKKEELLRFNNLSRKKVAIKTEDSEQKLNPPVPFDLTSLQTEAYKFFKIVPSKTLEIAQKLYLSGVISYPRTSSQKLPKEIGYDKIIKRLEKHFDQTKYINRKIPIEGKKSDPAHPSIYPTGEFQRLEGEEKKIYELIVKRFISCFCEDALISNRKIIANINKDEFYTKGISIKNKGWMEVYPMIINEKEIPEMKGEAIIEEVIVEEKLTQPPHRYSPASIISELEKRNLGTKATRAGIIEILYSRGYIKERNIELTSLGLKLVESLEKNCPIIIDEELTRKIERELEQIRESKKPFDKERAILEEAKEIIKKIADDFNKNKEKIGRDLMNAIEEMWKKEREDSSIAKCPNCNDGMLTIKYSKKTGKHFLACSQYPNCQTTFSLPPKYLIKKSNAVCEKCGMPLLVAIKKGKKPWVFCFNPNCESRKNQNIGDGNNTQIR
ncbi:MAG: DNA topoisomerase I [Candidatus Pacearchaeota archaeon]